MTTGLFVNHIGVTQISWQACHFHWGKNIVKSQNFCFFGLFFYQRVGLLTIDMLTVPLAQTGNLSANHNSLGMLFKVQGKTFFTSWRTYLRIAENFPTRQCSYFFLFGGNKCILQHTFCDTKLLHSTNFLDQIRNY